MTHVCPSECSCDLRRILNLSRVTTRYGCYHDLFDVSVTCKLMDDDLDITYINSLRKVDAQVFMDFLQVIIKSDTSDNSLRLKCREILDKLVRESKLLPTSLYLKNIVVKPDQVDAGGYADIYYGSYEGRPICAKALRVFRKGHSKVPILPNVCKEAMSWQQFTHPHILPFLGVSEEARPNQLCLITPWMEGGSVADFLSLHSNANRYMILYQAATAIEYLHNFEPNYFIHGDIKPDNLLVDARGIVYLADFGLTTLSETQTLSKSLSGNDGKGSLPYMAPDCFQGGSSNKGPPKSRKMDIYAFGITMYEILTDKTPFSDIQVGTIALQVKEGYRPSRPDNNPAHISDSTWDFINLCWHGEAHQRPEASTIVKTLRETMDTATLSEAATTRPTSFAVKIKRLPSDVSPSELRRLFRNQSVLNIDAPDGISSIFIEKYEEATVYFETEAALQSAIETQWVLRSAEFLSFQVCIRRLTDEELDTAMKRHVGLNLRDTEMTKSREIGSIDNTLSSRSTASYYVALLVHDQGQLAWSFSSERWWCAVPSLVDRIKYLRQREESVSLLFISSDTNEVSGCAILKPEQSKYDSVRSTQPPSSLYGQMEGEGGGKRDNNMKPRLPQAHDTKPLAKWSKFHGKKKAGKSPSKVEKERVRVPTPLAVANKSESNSLKETVSTSEASMRIPILEQDLPDVIDNVFVAPASGGKVPIYESERSTTVQEVKRAANIMGGNEVHLPPSPIVAEPPSTSQIPSITSAPVMSPSSKQSTNIKVKAASPFIQNSRLRVHPAQTHLRGAFDISLKHPPKNAFKFQLTWEYKLPILFDDLKEESRDYITRLADGDQVKSDIAEELLQLWEAKTAVTKGEEPLAITGQKI